jgi:hypothetical protein
MVETKTIAEEHEKAKKEIKQLMPGDAKVASGKGVTISYSKDGKKLVTIDKEAIKQADQDSGRPLPAPAETKPKATRSRKAANSNDKPAEPAADAA